MSRFLECLFLIGCCCALYMTDMTQRPLLKSSEGRVARVADEMLADGDWIVPHLNGVIRKEKPPLSSWLVAGTALAAGEKSVRPWHAYLPVVLAAMGLVLLVYGWIKSASPFLEHTGRSLSLPVSTAMILATAPGFLLQARSAELDMLLALLVALGMWGSWRHRSLSSGCPGALLIVYGALGLSVLAKGHAGLVIAVPALAIWHFWESTHAALPAQKIQWRWHLIGCILFLAIILPWGVPFLQRSGITWNDFFKEGVNRFHEKASHAEPMFWYFHQIPAWFLPWFLIFPFAVWKTRGLPPDERSPLRRLCCSWLLWSTLMFSLLTSKQRHYAVPFFAPLAILIADSLQRWACHFHAATARNGRSVFFATQIFLLIAVAAAPFMAIYGERREARGKDPQPFCRTIRDLVPPSKPLYDFDVALPRNVWRAQFLYYLGRKVTVVDSPLSEFLDQNAQACALVTEKVLLGVPTEKYTVLAQQTDFLGHSLDVFLIRSAAKPPAVIP